MDPIEKRIRDLILYELHSPAQPIDLTGTSPTVGQIFWEIAKKVGSTLGLKTLAMANHTGGSLYTVYYRSETGDEFIEYRAQINITFHHTEEAYLTVWKVNDR